jgi:hypothetical protein
VLLFKHIRDLAIKEAQRTFYDETLEHSISARGAGPERTFWLLRDVLGQRPEIRKAIAAVYRLQVGLFVFIFVFG